MAMKESEQESKTSHMQLKPKPFDKDMKQNIEEIKILYTCDQCEIDFTSMDKVEEHMVDEHDDEIDEEYLEPDLS